MKSKTHQGDVSDGNIIDKIQDRVDQETNRLNASTYLNVLFRTPERDGSGHFYKLNRKNGHAQLLDQMMV